MCVRVYNLNKLYIGGSNMNKVYLIGNITKDLELQYFGEEKRTFVKFTLAVNEYSSSRKEVIANFVNIIAFDKKAEILSKYISKGSKLSIEGKLRTGSYIDKNNLKKYTLDIILENFKFIDSNKNII